MDVAVLNPDGKEAGRKVTLPEDLFGIKPNDHAIYLDVKSKLANQRQGTAKAKERGEVKGSSRKLKKQKGTGTARAGNIRNPLYRGGGRVFGPRPRDYSFKLNKKVKDLARKSALTYKALDSAVIVVADFEFQEPRTKRYVELLQALSCQDYKTLLVLPENNKNIVLAGRNVPRAKVVTGALLNTYDVLHADRLILAEKSIGKLVDHFAGPKAAEVINS